MHSECPACGQDFRIEPGFYMGASYIHYGFTAIVTLATVLTDMAFLQPTPTWLLILVTILLNAALFPVCFRYARVLMLYWFAGIRFEPESLKRQVYVDASGDLYTDQAGEDFYTGDAAEFS
jgi:hypothetical protein